MFNKLSLMLTTLKFTNTGRSQFFPTVRKRVDAYFKENNLSPNANGAMWAKVTFFMTGYALLYGLILSNQFSNLTMLGLAMLLGMLESGALKVKIAQEFALSDCIEAMRLSETGRVRGKIVLRG